MGNEVSMWGLIIDGILIAIIVISAIIGVVKGFFDSLLGLISTGLSLVVAIFCSKFVAKWINSLFSLEDKILDKLDGGEAGTFKIFGAEFTNPEIAKFCVWIITAIALFLLTKLVIFILSKVFEKVTQNKPVISGINRVLGLVFGIVKGGVLAVILIALCSAAAQLPIIGNTISDKIGETKITSFAYKYVDEFVENQLTKENIDNLISKMVKDK